MGHFPPISTESNRFGLLRCAHDIHKFMYNCPRFFLSPRNMHQRFSHMNKLIKSLALDKMYVFLSSTLLILLTCIVMVTIFFYCWAWIVYQLKQVLSMHRDSKMDTCPQLLDQVKERMQHYGLQSPDLR